VYRPNSRPRRKLGYTVEAGKNRPAGSIPLTAANTYDSSCTVRKRAFSAGPLYGQRRSKQPLVEWTRGRRWPEVAEGRRAANGKPAIDLKANWARELTVQGRRKRGYTPGPSITGRQVPWRRHRKLYLNLGGTRRIGLVRTEVTLASDTTFGADVLGGTRWGNRQEQHCLGTRHRKADAKAVTIKKSCCDGEPAAAFCVFSIRHREPWAVRYPDTQRQSRVRLGAPLAF